MGNTLNKIDDETLGQYIYYVNGEAIKEEDMADANWQWELMIYLVSVLHHLYRYEDWYVGGNINIYLADNYNNRTAPDVVLVKGLVLTREERLELTSYGIAPPERPAPSVVFEIMSEATWDTDVNPDLKATRYGRFGVKEYFAFDPTNVWSGSTRRLIGWHYPNGTTPVEITADAQTGRLWSNELDSWLAVEDNYVRLYDQAGNMRLSVVEAKEAELEAVQTEYDAKLEATQAEAKAALRAQEEAERKLAEVYAKLRELKIDPDKL